MKSWATGLSLFFLLACDAPFVERATRVLVEPGGTYWELPVPFALRERGFDPDAPEGEGALGDAAQAAVEGSWSDGAIVVPVTGVIDPATLPEDSLNRDATVFLLTLEDNPERIPFTLELLSAEGPRPESLVARLAGAAPRPATRYALVVTDFVRDVNNSRLGRSEGFNDAWEGNAEADPELRSILLELRAALTRAEIELAAVAGAALFETTETVTP